MKLIQLFIFIVCRRVWQPAAGCVWLAATQDIRIFDKWVNRVLFHFIDSLLLFASYTYFNYSLYGTAQGKHDHDLRFLDSS